MGTSSACWVCVAAVLVAAARAQNLQLLGNSVVDQDFFVVGELNPGETLQQFTRRYRQQNPSPGVRRGPSGDSEAASAPRLPTAGSSPEPLGLPSGATQLLGRVDDSFSCEGLPYGYYADPSNDCRVYHVCNPIVARAGAETLQYSFFCNSGLEFDQRLLTCVPASFERSACTDARQLYESSNSQFFRDANFNDGVSVSVPTLSGPGQSSSSGDVILIGVTGGVPVGSIQPGVPPQGDAAGVGQAAGQPSDQDSSQGISGIGLNGVTTGLDGFSQISPPPRPSVTSEQSGPEFDQGSSLLDEFGVTLLDGGSAGPGSTVTDSGSEDFFTDGAGQLDIRLGLPRAEDPSTFVNLV